MDITIEARSLTFHKNKEAYIKGIHFQISSKKKVAFLSRDPDQIELIYNLIKGDVLPTAGELVVSGYNTKDHKYEAKKHMSIISSQEPLIEELLVKDYLKVFAEYYGLTGKKQNLKNLEALRIVYLENKDETEVQSLSPFEKRKLLIARALIVQPQVILAHHLSKGLSNLEALKIWDILNNITDPSIVLISNNLKEIEAVCNEVYILDEGQIILKGQTNELISNSLNEDVVEIPINKKEFLYFSSRLKENYEFFYDNYHLKVFLKEGQDIVNLLNLISSESMVLRKPDLSDIYIKTINPDSIFIHSVSNIEV